MNHIFLSDVHLGAFPEAVDKKIESDLIALLDYCTKHDIQLHILGDLFDYWMEYPGYKPKIGKSMLDAFERFNKNKFPVTYILGNHDNWTQGYFENQIGFRINEDYYGLTVDNIHFFLHHGDGLSDPTMKLPRPHFHKLLRSKWFTTLFQIIFPPDAGLHLMKTFSGMGRENIRIEPKRLDNWSESFLERSIFNVVISGHDHIPRVETFSFGTYINLGTFCHHRIVAHYTNGRIKLVTWSAEKNKLVPLNTPYGKETILK
jgi:UDP-2,3-diacylglucosamine hydrolase